MLICKDGETGKILGYAKDFATAREMARVNNWPEFWYADSPPDFSLTELNPGGDPRNMRGTKL